MDSSRAGFCICRAAASFLPLVAMGPGLGAVRRPGNGWAGRSILLALGLIALAACAPSSANPPIPEQWRSISVDAHPLQLGAERAGALRFRGGLWLTSHDGGFGGWSDLKVFDDNHVIAESDTGEWLSMTLQFDANGALTGVSEPRIALMRDEHGQPFETKDSGDAEDLAELPDGRMAVSFEQTQTIRIYDLNRDGPFGAAVAGPPLAGTEHLPPNVGLEGLAALPDGTLMVGSEYNDHGSSLMWRVPLYATAPVAPIARYPLEFGFGISSMDRMPDGRIVVLERFYAPVVGTRIRVSTFDPASIGGNQLIHKTELALLEAPLSLDNFEGVSAVRRADGGVRLYLIADDNFSAHQRTLLYAFDVEEAPAAPAH